MIKNKVALITGITGQDGSYLAELLLEKGYEVHGLNRLHQFNKVELYCFCDLSKDRKELKWKPNIGLNQLFAEMIEEDSNEAKKEYLLKNKGFSIYISQE